MKAGTRSSAVRHWPGLNGAGGGARGRGRARRVIGASAASSFSSARHPQGLGRGPRPSITSAYFLFPGGELGPPGCPRRSSGSASLCGLSFVAHLLDLAQAGLAIWRGLCAQPCRCAPRLGRAAGRRRGPARRSAALGLCRGRRPAEAAGRRRDRPRRASRAPALHQPQPVGDGAEEVHGRWLTEITGHPYRQSAPPPAPRGFRYVEVVGGLVEDQQVRRVDFGRKQKRDSRASLPRPERAPAAGVFRPGPPAGPEAPRGPRALDGAGPWVGSPVADMLGSGYGDRSVRRRLAFLSLREKRSSIWCWVKQPRAV